MYKGKLYFVTCRELGVPASKEASYQAANAWWRLKQVELDAVKPRHFHEESLKEMERRIAWERSRGDSELVRQLSNTTQTIREDAVGEYDLDILVYPSQVATAVWEERLSESSGQNQTTATKTIKEHIDRYLQLEMARHRIGKLSASQYQLTVLCLNHFSEWIGSGNLPSVITPDKWEDYWDHLTDELAKRKSPGYCTKRFRIAKTLVRWLATKGIIPVPLNLHEKRYTFTKPDPQIKVFSANQARELVDRADGQLKLHLLLMINCGFTQIDISDLHPDEIRDERIIRRRSKTGDKDNVPTVSYPLWPITWTLLQQYRSDDPRHVLVNRRGKPWVERARIDGQKSLRRDGIEANFRKLAPPCSLKTFRASSATLLDSSRDYHRFATYFLGHVAGSIAEKHYLQRGASFAELFDEATKWLGQQYGFHTGDRRD
jgi:integrase